MGFYNIMLEGEQAEAYKAKKAKEAEEAKNATERDFQRGSKVQYRDLGETDTERTYALGKSGNTYNGGKRTEIKVAGKETTSQKTKYNPNTGDYDVVGEKEYRTHDKDYVAVDPSKEDERRQKYATRAAKRAVKPGFKPDTETRRQVELARDAVNRNMRRHPEKWNKSHHESGIFESVEFLND